MSKIKLWQLGFVLALGSLLVAPSLASAAEFIAPAKDGNGSITIASSETHRNLYVAGGTVTINGNTTGDLYVAGGTVTIDGNVEQNLSAAGGTIIVHGKIGSNTRVFGGTISINGPIGGDLLVFGGSVTLSDKASVAGDLVVFGGTTDVNGPVGGYVMANGGSVNINSKISGTVKVRASKSLMFGSKADVAQAVDYSGPIAAVVADGAKVPTINYQKIAPPQKGSMKGLLAGVFLFKLLAFLAALLLLTYVFHRRVTGLVENMMRSPWKNLGIGLLALIVTPIIALILALIVVGSYIALVLMLAYLFMLSLSCLLGSLFLGAWILKLLMKKPQLSIDWQAALIGGVLVSVLGFVPFVGWLVVFILCLIGFGALVVHCRSEMGKAI